MNLQTKTEKNNFLALLLFGNLTVGFISLGLLLVQFVFFPQYFGITWAFLVVSLSGLTYFNLRFFKTQHKISTLWQWLKNHA